MVDKKLLLEIIYSGLLEGDCCLQFFHCCCELFRLLQHWLQEQVQLSLCDGRVHVGLLVKGRGGGGREGKEEKGLRGKTVLFVCVFVLL